MRTLIAAVMTAGALTLGVATPAMAAPTAQQCADAQKAINDLRALGTKYPQYASTYNAMADSQARAARQSGCPNVT